MQITFSSADGDGDAERRALAAMRNMAVKVIEKGGAVHEMEMVDCRMVHDRATLYGRLLDEDANPIPRGDMAVPLHRIYEVQVF